MATPSTDAEPPVLEDVEGDTDAIAVDRADVAAHKALRHRRYSTLQVPGLRLFGFVLLIAIVGVSNVATGFVPWSHVGWLAVAFLGYSLCSWALLLLTHDRGPFELGPAFLAVDPFVWMGAVHATGGAESWLYFLPLVRVADQLNTSRREAMVYTAVGVAAYGTLLTYLTVVERQTIAWNTQVGRYLFLAGCGTYLAATAGTAERLRTRLAEAVRTARDSIRQLQDQSVLLRDASERAEAASRAKSQFLANVSHEFRTPLNAIIGYAELVQEEMPRAPAHVQADLQRINRSAQHLRGLVNSVITLSQADVVRTPLSLQRLDVHTLLVDVTSVALPGVRFNNNVLEIEDAEGIGTIVADPTKLRQILIHLVGNAGKFTRDGHVRLTCVREPAGAGDAITFRVADTGVGMTPEELARVERFEPFVQADASETRQFDGTGLGLAIAHRFTRLMGGTLAIESLRGRGTTVTLRLPAVVRENAGAHGADA
jgi:signal transduction histidine kinase